MKEAEARDKIEDFLRSKGWVGDYYLEFEEAPHPEDSIWAFYTMDDGGNYSENTSYLHMDGSVESYGL